MRSDTRWHVIPNTATACWISLVFGVLIVVTTTMQMVSGNGVAIFPMIALVCGVALAALAVTGLVAPRLRGR
ncbi:hypothetical protein [Umezawaea tangerina]|uniref:Uncharacterized protein n=1 Tax=Umezawaea tangerina TaxID=84725 RepID=A0A2T0THF3_9PSEU|nr:hypothetical protein [Umezawaea tangerina]PRY45041.1 hypothetical protein CLV43_102606 [Umezawaea tangerina]